MSPLNRKLLRDLSRLKGQVLTIALVVACGIASYVTMHSTWSSLSDSKNSYFSSYRFADVFATLKRAPESLVKEVEAIPGVAQVYSRVVHVATLPMPNLTEVARAHIVSLPPGREPPLNGIYLRAGRFPEPGRDNEAVIVESFAKAHELHAGDRVPVVLNGKLRQIQIVGIGLSPEYVFLGGVGDFVPDDKQVAALWMNRDVLAPAFQMDGAFNDLSLRLQPGADQRAVMSILDTLLKPYGGIGAIARDRQVSSFLLKGELAQLERLATVVPAIFLAVAAFLLNVVLSRLIFLQRQQIAALKAVGYSTHQIMLHFLGMALVIVLLGSILGVAAGAYLGDGLIGVYAKYFRFPTLVFRVPPRIIATAIGVSAAAAVLGATFSVRQITNLSPAEAMRPAAPTIYRRGFVDRLRLDRFIGVSAMMVMRELRRRPLRTVLSSLGIAAAVGIMVVGRFGSDSIERLIDVIYNQEQKGDISIAFLEPKPVGVEHELESMPGVLDAEGLRLVSARLRSGPRWRDSAIIGIPENAKLRGFIDRNGEPHTLPDRGIALSQKLAEILELRLGDPVQVELREGDRRLIWVPVSHLIDDAFGLLAYMNMRELHARLNEEPSVSVVQLRVDSRESLELRRRLKHMPSVVEVTVKDEVVRRFKEQSARSMNITTLLLSVFGAIIAIGVVYNNARVALSIRGRDLGSLRVLGFTQREVSAILLGELAVQILLGIPIGLVLGRYWSAAIMASNDPETYRFAIYVSNQSYAYATSVALLAAIVSALLVRSKLRRQDLIAVLKTRE